MSNWWTFSALLIELVGAALVARGLSLQDPRSWVEGPGSPRWGYSADLDVDFASNSADASTGFFVFAGLVGFVIAQLVTLLGLPDALGHLLSHVVDLLWLALLVAAYHGLVAEQVGVPGRK
mgnify:CR=1 FL=1